jgi:PhnB protein
MSFVKSCREGEEGLPPMQLAPYLFFDGTCEEALEFYAEVLGGKISEINRFADSPMGESMPPEHRDRIMHATFVAPGMTLMASDGSDGHGEMRRASLSIATADGVEGARVFSALAAGGTVTMPYAKQFWGASFGMLVDKYGIRWMVNAG